MCSMCLSSPCNPRCPNAPEPQIVVSCTRCGVGIFEGEKYLKLSDGNVCKDCLNDMEVDELLEVFGESLTTAEKEE